MQMLLHATRTELDEEKKREKGGKKGKKKTKKNDEKKVSFGSNEVG